jgi:hypothetical protein
LRFPFHRLGGIAQPCRASDLAGKILNVEIDSDVAGNGSGGQILPYAP